MKTLGIIGSGELGKQIANLALNDNHYGDVKFIDDFATQKKINEIEVIGKLSEIENLYNNKKIDEIIIAIGYNYLQFKKQVFLNFENKIPFGKIIHSTSFIDKSAKISSGCVIYPKCVIDKNVQIKSNVLLNLSCTIAHDSIINAHTFVAPEVAIAGFSNIGQCCNIGINATIIENIIIADNTQIGAGSVVIKKIEQSGLYVGNPVRKIR